MSIHNRPWAAPVECREPLAPSVMAEILYFYGVRPDDLGNDAHMTQELARVLVFEDIRLFRAPDDFDAIRADLDSLWRGERPARFAA